MTIPHTILSYIDKAHGIVGVWREAAASSFGGRGLSSLPVLLPKINVDGVYSRLIAVGNQLPMQSVA